MVWFNISIDNGYLTVIFLGPYFRNRLVKAYDKLVNTTGVMFSEHNELEQVSRHIVLKGLMYILMQMTTEPLPNSWKFPFVMIYPFSYYLYFGCRVVGGTRQFSRISPFSRKTFAHIMWIWVVRDLVSVSEK